MSSLIRRILLNKSTRMIFLIFLFVNLIVIFFLTYNYFSQLRLYEEIQYNKISAITKTLSHSINGDIHDHIIKKYPNKDDIKSNDQDSNYLKIHQKLLKTQRDNKTGSTIYTLVYDSKKNVFKYGVSSSEIPFYKHHYTDFPAVLKENYKKGGIIPKYSDENGTWISAFSPIYNSKNEVVGIIEADVKFNEFISRARTEIFKNLGIALFVILIIAIFLYRSVKKILIQEEQTKNMLIRQKKIIEDKNKDITDSINYAKKIQDAILPTNEDICLGIERFFVMFKPRDIVSGDFYWHHTFEDKSQIIAVADCTGHGIPGALVSVIGSSLLNEIVKQRNIKSPAKILQNLDEGVNNGLGSATKPGDQRDGMDISICFINASKTKLIFSGAFRPLLKVTPHEMTEYKGSRFPIGGGDLYSEKTFEEQEIPINPGDSFYMFSDGFADQFGGPKGKKLMIKRFKDVLRKNIHLTFDEQCLELENFMENWKGEHDQNDDVLVVGFTFP